jgi:Methyltransferase domain
MSAVEEISRRYVPPLPSASPAAPPSKPKRSPDRVRLLLLPVLIVAAVAMALVLRIFLWRRSSNASTLHGRALDSVDLFVEQYPLHLYPILCKSLELAVLREELQGFADRRHRILEVAIGDGTLSARVFPPEAEVVGLDISPYYLHHARQMKHVQEAVVCDCLEPPLREGSFDLIVANNFLHHVTEKSRPLAAWSVIAENAVFNENTVYWASSWVRPYVLAALGLKDKAARATHEIEQVHWQSLLTMDRLNAIVKTHYEIQRAVSYLSARTFFLCAIFSFLMRCTGPPTPPRLKRIFLGPLRSLVLPLTKTVARLLVRFDEFQDRSRDAYVSYVGRSRAFSRSGQSGHLVCPTCRGSLDTRDACVKCGTEYVRGDGLLFLLSRDMDHIRTGYQVALAATLEKELL